MATVRNPLAGFAITIFGALALAFLAGIPILFLPQAELVYFYLPFALFGVGMLSGRSGFLGTLGFVGGTLGGFVGIYVFHVVRPPGMAHLARRIGDPLGLRLRRDLRGRWPRHGENRATTDRPDGGPRGEDAPLLAVRREGWHRGPQVLVLPGLPAAHRLIRFRSSSCDPGSARRSGPCRGGC